MSAKKAVIYTAISGAYDRLKQPEYLDENFDYVCFTDNQDLESSFWRIVPFQEQFGDHTLNARHVKLLPHRYFSDYEYSIWVDANILIKGDLNSLLDTALQDADIAMFEHPHGRASIRDEVDACIALKKESKKKLTFQRDLYYSLTFEDEWPVIPATYVVLRRHDRLALVAAMEEWWSHILTYGKRDQVSFPFVAWKQALDFYAIARQEFENYFAYFPHVRDEKEQIFAHLSQGGVFHVSNANGTLKIVRQQPALNLAGAAEAIYKTITREDGRIPVLHGPFAGLLYPSAHAVGSALLPKFLGSYESELHDVLERICQTSYQTIINIGAGEGYYANGLLKRIETAHVHAFEMDPGGQEFCKAMARCNHQEQRLEVDGECTQDRLAQLVAETGSGLIVCDCEGCEVKLLDPETVPGLNRFDLFVELHDFDDSGPTIAQQFATRFAPTHAMEFINIRAHKPIERLSNLGVDPKTLQALLSEGRLYSVGWVILRSRQTIPD